MNCKETVKISSLRCPFYNYDDINRPVVLDEFEGLWKSRIKQNSKLPVGGSFRFIKLTKAPPVGFLQVPPICHIKLQDDALISKIEKLNIDKTAKNMGKNDKKGKAEKGGKKIKKEKK